jgi:hypothetical protein
MQTLGEDIVLLAIRPGGKLGAGEKLRFAVAGSELVRLAAERRVDVVKDRIHVLSQASTGEALLDAALADIQRSKRPPRARDWVARERRGLVHAYLDELAARGVIRADRHKALGIFNVTRWTVLDPARAAEARARLDAVARSTGPVDSAQSALGGLVHAIGLDALIYPRNGGPACEIARKRLKQIARRDQAATAVHSAAQQAAVEASIDAAVDASVRAAVDASVHAAVDASVHAAHHAAHDGGAAGGGHH